MLEWIETNLATSLKESPLAGWYEFWERVGLPLLEALVFSHNRECIHRDIKPNNILINAKGIIKLADFGISKLKGWLQPTVTLREEDKRDYDIKAEEAIQKLAKGYPDNLVFKRLGDTHCEIIISDQKFAIVGSFNWLSFKGDPKRTFRDERSTLVSDPNKIDELFEDEITRLIEKFKIKDIFRWGFKSRKMTICRNCLMVMLVAKYIILVFKPGLFILNMNKI